MTKIAKKLAILLVLITIALISFNQVKAVDLNLTENTSSSNSTLSSDDEDDEEPNPRCTQQRVIWKHIPRQMIYMW